MEEHFQTGGVAGTLHRPEGRATAAMVLTHGAGSDANAPLLVQVARACAEAGWLALRFDLPFRQRRPKGPPFPAGAARDREGIAEAVAAARGLGTGRVFAGGHSYGGRQTAMLAAERPGIVDGLLLLSYPLQPPRKPDEKRTGFFLKLWTPVLFVHGTKDPFGSIEELRGAIALIPAATGLMPVEGAGHDLKRAMGLAPALLERFRAVVSS